MRCKYCNSKLELIKDVHTNVVVCCTNPNCYMVVRTKKHFLDEAAALKYLLKMEK